MMAKTYTIGIAQKPSLVASGHSILHFPYVLATVGFLDVKTEPNLHSCLSIPTAIAV